MGASKMLRRAVLAVLLALCPVVAFANASGQNLQVIPLSRDGEVLISFKLEEKLTDEVRAAIQSGLTVKFVYKVDLVRSSAAWFDRTIASAVIAATVRYDTLTRLYHMTRTRDGRTEWADTTAKEDVAWAMLTTEFARLSLFPRASLEPNAEYYVRVRANASPRNAAFVWPWQGDHAMGFAKFTFVR